MQDADDQLQLRAVAAGGVEKDVHPRVHGPGSVPDLLVPDHDGMIMFVMTIFCLLRR